MSVNLAVAVVVISTIGLLLPERVSRRSLLLSYAGRIFGGLSFVFYHESYSSCVQTCDELGSEGA